VLACDYYVNESKDEDSDDEEEQKKREERKKEALEAYEKAKAELNTTKYENIKVV